MSERRMHKNLLRQATMAAYLWTMCWFFRQQPQINNTTQEDLLAKTTEPTPLKTQRTSPRPALCCAARTLVAPWPLPCAGQIWPAGQEWSVHWVVTTADQQQTNQPNDLAGSSPLNLKGYYSWPNPVSWKAERLLQARWSTGQEVERAWPSTGACMVHLLFHVMLLRTQLDTWSCSKQAAEPFPLLMAVECIRRSSLASLWWQRGRSSLTSLCLQLGRSSLANPWRQLVRRSTSIQRHLPFQHSSQAGAAMVFGKRRSAL